MNEILEKIGKTAIVPVVLLENAKDAKPLARALCDGGLPCAEVTFRTEAAEEGIRVMAEEFPQMLVGAGTVTEPGLVELTHRAGGCFIISPDTNEAVIRRTRELDMVSMPGAMTPTEILTAHRAGADFVKLFPAAGLGPAYLRAVCAPLSHVKIMVVGGIDEKNVGAFLAAGAAGAGVGGNLANRQWIRDGAWDKITQAAQLLTGAVRQG